MIVNYNFSSPHRFELGVELAKRRVNDSVDVPVFIRHETRALELRPIGAIVVLGGRDGS
jgi:hypothetical protein